MNTKKGKDLKKKVKTCLINSQQVNWVVIYFSIQTTKNRRVKSHNTNAAFVIVKRKRKSNISLIVTDSVELFYKKQTQKRKLNNSGKRWSDKDNQIYPFRFKRKISSEIVHDKNNIRKCTSRLIWKVIKSVVSLDPKTNYPRLIHSGINWTSYC